KNERKKTNNRVLISSSMPNAPYRGYSKPPSKKVCFLLIEASTTKSYFGKKNWPDLILQKK
ncbi:hypothetical protein SYJ56_25500, partial [Algoriphagus sp. D3-2-R+10]|uniref:hypothetical protein n=1 Tax=Algoriphagus aurantiacus TaxID=3103948 RepID=UPI002B384473